MRFKGKVAIVTGGSKGIGKVIAKQLAQEGASTVINGRDMDALEKATREIGQEGGRITAIQADVSNRGDVETMIDKIIEDHGRIDILINNAAVFAESVRIMDLEEEEWDRVMTTNLKGIFLCAKAAIKQMIKQKSGKIVNMTSFTGKTGRVVYSTFGSPTKAHYCASKAGIISLTKSLAYELAPYNINVNGVAAGSVAPEGTPEEKKEMIIPLVPLGRMGTSEDVSAATLFLASDESSFITGEILDVNGGTLMD
jgi:NAD(P)-dependent dehydrogenase (short-subunit alcohol dehydrogenase family)